MNGLMTGLSNHKAFSAHPLDNGIVFAPLGTVGAVQ
jgi:hypothetical protein